MFTPSEAEYQILSKLSSASLPMPLSAFENDDHQRIHMLIQNKFILRSWEGSLLSISASGKDFLSQYDRELVERQHRSSQDQQAICRLEKWNRRSAIRQWILGFLGVLSSITTFTLGVLVENDAPIKHWILSLFR